MNVESSGTQGTDQERKQNVGSSTCKHRQIRSGLSAEWYSNPCVRAVSLWVTRPPARHRPLIGATSSRSACFHPSSAIFRAYGHQAGERRQNRCEVNDNHQLHADQVQEALDYPGKHPGTRVEVMVEIWQRKARIGEQHKGAAVPMASVRLLNPLVL